MFPLLELLRKKDLDLTRASVRCQSGALSLLGLSHSLCIGFPIPAGRWAQSSAQSSLHACAGLRHTGLCRVVEAVSWEIKCLKRSIPKNMHSHRRVTVTERGNSVFRLPELGYPSVRTSASIARCFTTVSIQEGENALRQTQNSAFEEMGNKLQRCN